MSEPRTTYAAAPLRATVSTYYDDIERFLPDPDYPAAVDTLMWQAWAQVDVARGAVAIFQGAGATEAEAVADALGVARECLNVEVVCDERL